jgi:GxxExxY protein
MNNNDFLYKELSHTIIGIAMHVHTKLGAGLPEICYSRAMAIELDIAKIPYSREFRVLVEYDEQPVGHLTPDFVIDSKIILEVRL